MLSVIQKDYDAIKCFKLIRMEDGRSDDVAPYQ